MIKVCCKIYNFVSYRRTVFVLSFFLCIVSFIIIINRGFNWGLDFTGGFFIEIVSDSNLDIKKIQDSFIKLGFKKVFIQNLNNSKNIIIRLPLMHNCNNFDQEVKNKILYVLNKNVFQKFTIQRMNWIGPSTSQNLIKKGVVALLVSLFGVVIYITLRFKLKFAIGTIASLIYNIIIILGMLSIFLIEINSTVIAALISVIGYSLNDNIVIFDRIRENFKRISTACSYDIFNISLSQVLHRTIITSITTVMVLLILLIFGGTMLYEFSITLLIGVIGGTISSIYIASLLAFSLQIKYGNSIKKK